MIHRLKTGQAMAYDEKLSERAAGLTPRLQSIRATIYPSLEAAQAAEPNMRVDNGLIQIGDRLLDELSTMVKVPVTIEYK